MTTRILKGSKEEIARQLIGIDGEVRQAIILVEDPATPPLPVPETVEEMFREMEPYMADAGDVDYSRDAIYSRKPGE